MFKNKDGRIRSGWKIAGMLGLFFLSVILIGIVIGILSCIYYLPGLFKDGTLDLQGVSDAIKENSFISYATIFTQEILGIIIPVLIWKFIIKRPLFNMGLTPLKRNYRELLTGLLFGTVSMTIVFLLLVATGNATVQTWLPHFTWEQLLYIFIFISVGFAEEIMGRGYIMSVLRQTRSVPAIMLISAVIFALMHSMNSGIALLPYINLALVGILFAYIYIKSGNIWMSIGYHITWNYFQGYVYGFKVSGTDSSGILTTQYHTNNILNGGTFGPEGGLFVTIVVLSGILFVKYYYRNSTYDFIASEPAGLTGNQMEYRTEKLSAQNTDACRK